MAGECFIISHTGAMMMLGETHARIEETARPAAEFLLPAEIW
ncbi:MAG: hypothetical protein ACD_39C00496G0001 [uncultured bacterium]|nr:MAG: hypothetical protein ACD_39C00496G0001 [uncultured bacterium]